MQISDRKGWNAPQAKRESRRTKTEGVPMAKRLALHAGSGNFQQPSPLDSGSRNCKR